MRFHFPPPLRRLGFLPSILLLSLSSCTSGPVTHRAIVLQQMTVIRRRSGVGEVVYKSHVTSIQCLGGKVVPRCQYHILLASARDHFKGLLVVMGRRQGSSSFASQRDDQHAFQPRLCQTWNHSTYVLNLFHILVMSSDQIKPQAIPESASLATALTTD